ncbi:MAG: hypothetical protein ACLFQM_08285 [Fidelibacterota bacterium]
MLSLFSGLLIALIAVGLLAFALIRKEKKSDCTGSCAPGGCGHCSCSVPTSKERHINYKISQEK